MSKTRLKTISYRRAVWLKADNLERLLDQALSKLPKVVDRKFLREDGQVVKSIRHKKSDAGHYIYIVAETPGDHASTLARRNESKDAFDIDTVPPPAGSEYMDGDVFLYVKDNDVCLCTTGLREATASMFLRLLIEKAGLPKSATQFELQKIANIDKARLIQAQGVREVDIRASMFDATHKYLKRKTSGEGTLAAIGKHLNSIFEDDEGVRDNLQVSVVLRARSRGLDLSSRDAHAAQAVGAQRLQALAEALIEGDSDYVIVTGDGQRISPDEIYVRVKMPIEALGKTTSCKKTWDAMKTFYDQLVENGILVQ